MTGKERAEWRAKANGIETILQIGKGGITDALIEQLEGALDTRELIKIRVLESSPISVRECADEISKKTGAEIIQVIGSKAVFYRFSIVLHDKIAQKKQNIKKAEKIRIKKLKLKPADPSDKGRQTFSKAVSDKSRPLFGRKNEGGGSSFGIRTDKSRPSFGKRREDDVSSYSRKNENSGSSYGRKSTGSGHGYKKSSGYKGKKY